MALTDLGLMPNVVDLNQPQARTGKKGDRRLRSLPAKSAKWLLLTQRRLAVLVGHLFAHRLARLILVDLGDTLRTAPDALNGLAKAADKVI